MPKQRGLSLIELMIAITLGLIMMTGVVQMFLSSRVTFTSQQAISRVQETGRLAIHFITQDVRMAGYTGFRGRGATITNTLAPVTLFNNYVEGISVLSGPQTGITALDGTDVLVIRGASGISTTVNDDVAAGLIKIPLGGQCAAGGLECMEGALVIADYMKAVVFAPSGVGVNGSNVEITYAGGWGGDIANPDEFFTYGSQVSPMQTIVYFIGTGASGQPALFQNIDGETMELLEGVVDMSITYSRFSDPNTYENAAGEMGAFWSDTSNPLVSMRMEILVSSVEDNVVDSPQSYTFSGVTEEAEDRRLYQVFMTTVALRNLLP